MNILTATAADLTALQQTNRRTMMEARAHLEQDIKDLLVPHLLFKLHMRFAPRHPGGKRYETRQIYGNEHSVTYKQCLFGRVPHIVLNRLKGYTGLCQYVEETLKRQYIACKLYMDDGSRTFPTLCRHWYKGGLVEQQDPVLTDADNRILNYNVVDGRLVVFESKPS